MPHLLTVEADTLGHVQAVMAWAGRADAIKGEVRSQATVDTACAKDLNHPKALALCPHCLSVAHGALFLDGFRAFNLLLGASSRSSSWRRLSFCKADLRLRRHTFDRQSVTRWALKLPRGARAGL